MIKAKDISTVVVWGTIWGMMEAILGYLTNLFTIKFQWCIWFPLAFYFLNKTYIQTKKKETMLYTALIAIVIRLLNLFMGTNLDKVVNASATIISEVLAMVIVCKILEKWEVKLSFIRVICVNCLWRIIYTAYVLLMPVRFIFTSHLRDIKPAIEFFYYENIITTLIVFFLIAMEKYMLKDKSLNKN